MARLIYCALEPAQLELPPGVAGTKVAVAQIGALHVLHSEAEPPRLAGNAREYALQFHAVIAAAFAHHAVISFRYPTLFPSETEMLAEIGPRAASLAAFLRDNAGAVQMEVRLSVDPAPAPDALSGTAYLQHKRQSGEQLESAATACRNVLANDIRDWRQRRGSHGLHCYALLARDAVPAYREAMSALSLPAGVRALVSGPWPANEFVEIPR